MDASDLIQINQSILFGKTTLAGDIVAIALGDPIGQSYGVHQSKPMSYQTVRNLVSHNRRE